MHHVIVAHGEVAIRALDLDDARAGLRETPGAERCSNRLLESHHQNSVEYAGHESPVRAQKDFGMPSTWVPTCERIRFVEMGAT
jgi:hypothetical protein